MVTTQISQLKDTSLLECDSVLCSEKQLEGRRKVRKYLETISTMRNWIERAEYNNRLVPWRQAKLVCNPCWGILIRFFPIFRLVPVSLGRAPSIYHRSLIVYSPVSLVSWDGKNLSHPPHPPPITHPRESAMWGRFVLQLSPSLSLSLSSFE